MIKVKNTGEETLAFSGVPAIPAGETIEVADDIAEVIQNHPDIEIVKDSVKGTESNSKKSTFKGVEE